MSLSSAHVGPTALIAGRESSTVSERARQVETVNGGILLVTELYPPAIGGSAELFGNVYSRARASVEVTVLADKSSDRGSVSDLAEQHAVTLVRHPIRAHTWGVLSPSAVRHHAQVARRIRTLARQRIGAVHCGRSLPEGVAALLACSTLRVPFVCWAHGEELAYAQSSRELGLLLRFVHRRATALLANSRNTSSLLEKLGVPAHKLHVVYPGVDASRFRPDVDGAAALRARLAGPDEVLLLSVGRLQRRKGHDLVIEALAGVARTGPRLRYVIAGDGDERARLERMVRDAALDRIVTFVGSVQASDLPAYYAAADIFVHPNRLDGFDFEGFGIVFLEAAAAGLPVIGGRTGGVSEAVADGETGLLVSGVDVDELRSAILRLADAPAVRQAMGRRGRARAIEEFNWNRATERVVAIHRRVQRPIARR